MDAAVSHYPSAAVHDPVQTRHRPAGMEAFAAVGEVKMMSKIPQASAMRTPFIKIAHQDGRQIILIVGGVGDDRGRLTPPPQAGKIEMHSEYTQPVFLHQQFGHHRTARFETGDMQNLVL